MKAARGEVVQRQYYTATSTIYDSMHVRQDSVNYDVLGTVWWLMQSLGVSSVLDVGCGTGRGLSFFVERKVRSYGVEPVPAMLEQAIVKNQELTGKLLQGSGVCLPFRSASFDAICEFGVLHHVANPDAVVKEMMRVARRGVFLSDSNRFGQGRWSVRVAKLVLYKMNLWKIANVIKTRGKGYGRCQPFETIWSGI